MLGPVSSSRLVPNGRTPEGRNPEGESTDAGRRGRLPRSSSEAPVTGAEPRGRATQDRSAANHEVGGADPRNDATSVAGWWEPGEPRGSRRVLRGAWGCESPGLPHWGVRFPPATHLVVLCRTERDAQEALRRVGLILGRLGLRLQPTKTQLVFVGDGEQGFDFLGFHCRKVASWRARGRRYLQRWPSRRAMQRVRDRVKAISAPRHRLPEPVQALVTELNAVVRGWGAYFRVGNSSRQLSQVDSYVRERLGLFMSKKAGRHGRGWGRHPLAYFRTLGVYELAGTVRWYQAAPKAVR